MFGLEADVSIVDQELFAAARRVFSRDGTEIGTVDFRE